LLSFVSCDFDFTLSALELRPLTSFIYNVLVVELSLNLTYLEDMSLTSTLEVKSGVALGKLDKWKLVLGPLDSAELLDS
jgi:hypothetical protein